MSEVAEQRRGRGRPRDPARAKQRRAEIVDAATQVFAAEGYHRAQMARVAQVAGVGQGTLYRHFGGKRELLDAVVDDVVATLMEPLLEVGLGHEPDLAVRLRGVADRLLEVNVRRPELLRALGPQLLAADEEMRHRLLGLGDTLAATVGTELQHGVQAGVLRPQTAGPDVALALLMLVIPMLPGLIEGEDEQESRRRLESVLDIALRGVSG